MKKRRVIPIDFTDGLDEQLRKEAASLGVGLAPYCRELLRFHPSRRAFWTNQKSGDFDEKRKDKKRSK